ncbi:hypothetical protein F5141DRAFT_1061743 [Pisolithus sp. B1]|nr:hypothetical protein F5141DRAFT_1061743 [Pisolithus sp. B1]
MLCSADSGHTADQPNLFMPGEFLTHSKWRDTHIHGVLVLFVNKRNVGWLDLPVPMVMHLQCCRLQIKYNLVPISTEGPPSQELQGDMDLTIKHSFMESSSDLNNEEPNEMDPQTTFDTDIDDQCDHSTSLCLKDETTALENMLHDLMYLCSAITQQIMSFSYDLNLVFESQPTEPDHSPYQLYSSIPPGPNMGHRQLSKDVSENEAILGHKCWLYEVLFLVMLEDELHRIDAIQQAAWNGLLSRGADPNLGQIQGLVVQNGNDEWNKDVYQSKHGTPNKGSYVIVNTAQSRFVSESLSFMLSHVVNDTQAPKDRKTLLKFPRDYHTILNHFNLDPHL